MNRENGIIFEWDEQKRQANLAKHDLDFIDAADVLLTRTFQ